MHLQDLYAYYTITQICKEWKYGWRLMTKQKKYVKWVVFGFAYIGYALYYVCRKNLSVLKSPFMDNTELDLLSVGQFDTIVAVGYGVGKLVLGLVADAYGAQNLLCIGLFASGVVNMLLGVACWVDYSPYFFVQVSMLLALNAFIQACGWSACSRILTFWLGAQNRGILWGIFGSSYMIGEMGAVGFATYVLQVFGWQAGFFVPGLLCCVAAVVIWYGLHYISIDSVETSRLDQMDKKQNISVVDAISSVMFHFQAWAFAISYMGVYFIRSVLSEWSMLWVTSNGGSAWMAVKGIVCFNIGGILGMLLWGSIADKAHNMNVSRIWVILLDMCLLMVLTIIGILWFDVSMTLGFYLLMLMYGVLVFGPQMLFGLSIAEIVELRAVGTITGFAGVFAYIGSAIAGAPLGWGLKTYGWKIMLLSVCISSVISIYFMLLGLGWPKMKYGMKQWIGYE